jgi:hypothetical protein
MLVAQSQSHGRIGVVGHPALRILRKFENLICVQLDLCDLCRLQRLMEKPTSSR